MKKSAKKAAKKENPASVERPEVKTEIEVEEKNPIKPTVPQPVPHPKKSEFKLEYDAMGEYSDYMYNTMARILREVGPRAPGSPEEQKAAYLVYDELKQSCDEVHMEDFYCYPRAFLGWIRLDIVTLIVSFVLFLFTRLGEVQRYVFTIIPIACGVFAFLCIYKQFLSYAEWTPKFLPYKKKHSQNVIATFKPQGEEVKRRVIFSGHIDSAFRFNLIHYTKAGYAYFFLGGILALVAFFLIFILQLIMNFIGNPLTVELDVSVFLNWVVFILPIFMAIVMFGAMKTKKIFFGAFRHLNNTAQALIIGNTIWSALMFILFNTSFFPALMIFDSTPLVKTAIFIAVLNLLPINALLFFVSKKAVPGAVDNLSAVVICLAIAKILQEWRERFPEKYPKNTEVKIAIVGCEEVGLRGSEAFARRHAQEFNAIDTTCVNLESPVDPKTMTFFKKEKTTGTDLSPEVYNLLDQCANELGFRHSISQMPGVSGGTDGAGLVRGGLRASTICGLKYKDYLAYYHTDRDNIDVINKERRPWTDYHTDRPNRSVRNGNGQSRYDPTTTWQTRNMRASLEKALAVCIKYLEKKDADTTPYVSPKLAQIIRQLSFPEKEKLSELLNKERKSK